jgi:tetratricopeptide (TPR) repeat protein
MREAIAAYRLRQGPGSAEAARIEIDLAKAMLAARGDSALAESRMRRAVVTLRSSLGEQQVVVAWALNDLAFLLAAKGRYAEAERLVREGLDIQRAAFGPDHHNVGGMLGTLAWVMTRSGRYVEAESLRREELATLERSLGATHSVYAASFPAWGDALADLDRFYEAIAAHERGIALRSDIAPDNPLRGIGKANLAAIYSRKGDYATADSLFGDGLRIILKRFPSTHFDVRRIYGQMSDHYARAGHATEARKYAELAKPR